MDSSLVYSAGSRSTALPHINMLRAVGWRAGIVKELYLGGYEDGDPQVFHVTVMNARVDRLLGLPFDVNLRAAGSGLTLEDALNRALGEVLERYSAYVSPPSNVIRATGDEMRTDGHRAIRADDLPVFSEEQYRRPNFPFVPFEDEQRLAWIEGTSLLDGNPYFVPAQLVSFGYIRNDDEPPIGYPTSSGCACARTLEEALLKGIYEQVERDAFMCAWFSRVRGLAEVDLSDGGDLIDSLWERGFFTGSLRPQLRILPSDLGVHAFLGIGKVKVGLGASYFVGGSAHHVPELAAFKALLEVGQGVPFVKSILLDRDPLEDAEQMDNFDDNLRFYAESENASRLDFLIDSGKSIELATLKDGESMEESHQTFLTKLLHAVEGVGMHPIGFDLTASDVQSLGCHVGRVYVPELVQLGTPAFPFLGSTRIWDMPSSLGYECLPQGEANPDIHPYP